MKAAHCVSNAFPYLTHMNISIFSTIESLRILLLANASNDPGASKCPTATLQLKGFLTKYAAMSIRYDRYEYC